ncbi:cytokinin dehydrogenase 3 isoform X1 [Musa acuminata AAA Group]|uniref:cytokinin dehydrogenase 3 isoform X1 n=1 Tax=Musa acuminata AAA Group TaxID=214697 RepID=UPI0031DDE2D1
MEFALFCTKVNILILILALCSPCKFIQSPMDFGPSNLLETKSSASLDFGRIVFNSPSAVLRPQSPRDISLLLTFLSASSFSKVTIAARGAGHSIYGQAQALDGIVIEMDSIPSDIYIHKKRDDGSGFSYADVGGGALWVELLEESLKHGLAPRSWTDYLYLSIGGTLSNGGISGQTFKYGPQISNVLQLDVVTGKGDWITCSPTSSSELFYAVLGGLGQFGIITRARILLQDAPQKVKWIRAFYDDFDTFTGDQELLVSMPELVDYVEGFIVPNEQSLLSTSVAFPAHLGFMPEFHHVSSAKVYYCIEFAVHDFQAEGTSAEQVSSSLVVEKISKHMSYMPSLMYSVEVSYFDFLNRVRMEEMNLRSRGLWEIPHPWLNMFVPKSGIKEFKDLLLENISPNDFEGPILIYPLLRDNLGGTPTHQYRCLMPPRAATVSSRWCTSWECCGRPTQPAAPPGASTTSSAATAELRRRPRPGESAGSSTSPTTRPCCIGATTSAGTGTGLPPGRTCSTPSASWLPAKASSPEYMLPHCSTSSISSLHSY